MNMKIYKQKASGRTEEVDEGFDILAFLFGPLWYLFKGMIGRAILVFIGILIFTAIFGWVGAIIAWIIIGFVANATYENYLISKGFTIINTKNLECTGCGTKVFGTETFCSECGGKFKDKKIKCPSCKTNNGDGTKFCIECGHKLFNKLELKNCCEYCDKKFSSVSVLNKHYDHCESKKEKAEKDRDFLFWLGVVIIFLAFGGYFFNNNKVNLIPLAMIGFIISPLFDKTLKLINNKNNKLKSFEWSWLKKSIVILAIIIFFALFNIVNTEQTVLEDVNTSSFGVESTTDAENVEDLIVTIEPKEQLIEDTQTAKELSVDIVKNCKMIISTCTEINSTCITNELSDYCPSMERLCDSYNGLFDAMFTIKIDELSNEEIIELINLRNSTLSDLTKYNSETPEIYTEISDYLETCQKAFQVGETFTAGNFEWTVKSMRTASSVGNSYFPIIADGEYLILYVEVENVGTSAEYLSSSFLKLVDDQGREFVSDSSAQFYLEGSLAFDTINPGIVKKGEIAFDVPVGLTVVDLMISDSMFGDSFYYVNLLSEHID